MKERPILFSAAMVRALLDGCKTQTRRIVKKVGLAAPAPQSVVGGAATYAGGMVAHCPYGQPGDRLWVRESFWGCDLPGYGDQPCVVYDDEWSGKEYAPSQERPWARKFGRIPSIHMPRDCSRILLEIVSVRVERLNDCSDTDARAEGAPGGHGVIPSYHYNSTPSEHYAHLWESINGAGSWSANPWVWVIEFKRVVP
jgi:hypothetical protein